MVDTGPFSPAKTVRKSRLFRFVLKIIRPNTTGAARTGRPFFFSA